MSEIRPSYYKVRVPVTEIIEAEDGTYTGIVECFDLVDGMGLDFYQGNVLKYLMRAGKKNPDPFEDKRKVFTYADQSVKRHG